MTNLNLKSLVLAAVSCAAVAGMAEETTIQSTGVLNYQDQAVFEKDWKTTLAAEPTAAKRWGVYNTGKENGWVLRGGIVRTAASPYRHVVYQKDGNPTFFDVTGEGPAHAFKAHTDFSLVSSWGRPMERVYISLAAVSPDAKQSYTVALYANNGKDNFKNNYFRFDMVDFTTGKMKGFLFKETKVPLEMGKWYRLEFTMTKQGTQERSPVILTASLFEIKDGRRDGAKGAELASASSKTMPNLGLKVQFGMVEPSSVYRVNLANVEAEAVPAETEATQKKK